MRRLGLSALLVASACFNPNDPDATGTDSGSSSGTTEPTSDSVTTNPGSTTDTPTTTSPTSADSTATETTDDPTMTGGSPMCDDATVCVESAPDGWSGPGIRLIGGGGEPPMCGDAYPILDTGGFAGAMAPPAQCECSCDLPEDTVCPDASIVYYDGEMCEQGQGTNTLADGECGTFFIGQGIASVTAQGNPPEDVQCEPMLTADVPPPVPVDPTTICVPESLGDSCGDGSTCLPGAEVNNYCISREGDVPCPADSAYDDRTVLYTGLNDNRGCEDCECGAADIECVGMIRAYPNAGCAGPFINVPIDNTCVESIDDIYNDARYFAAPATGACAASLGTPIGEVTLNNPTTICCADF